MLLSLLEPLIARADSEFDGAVQRLPTDPRKIWRNGIKAFFTAFDSQRAVARAGTEALATSPEIRAVWSGFMQRWIDQTAVMIRRRTGPRCRAEDHPGGGPGDVAEPDERTHDDGDAVRRTARGQQGPGGRDTGPHLGQQHLQRSRRGPVSPIEPRVNGNCRENDANICSCAQDIQELLAASILHADLDSFYACVEQRDDPALRGRPVLVGGGVVLAASYEAKAFGVRTAMGGAQARRLCPHAVVVPPRMNAYMQASDAVFEVFRDTTPIVEPLSVDEAFLDVGGLLRVSGTPVQIAARLRADVRERVRLPITVGVARTKFLAKVASQQAKPDGLLLVPPADELAFLHPLSVRRLWGVGAKTAERLHVHGLHTVADVAELSESTLASMVGQAMGRQLYIAVAKHRPPPGDHCCAKAVGRCATRTGPCG